MPGFHQGSPADDQPRYTQRQVEEMIARRRVEDAKWERINVITKGFDEIQSTFSDVMRRVDVISQAQDQILRRLDTQDNKIADVHNTATEARDKFDALFGHMDAEELAAVVEGAKEAVFRKTLRQKAGKWWNVALALAMVIATLIGGSVGYWLSSPKHP